MFNISISNIAWSSDLDEDVWALLNRNEIYSIDISPFRDANDYTAIGSASANNLNATLRSYNLATVGLQGLLFRFPDLVLFDSRATRTKMLTHLKEVCNFAHNVGASRLVFGSPNNKKVGNLPNSKAFRIAHEFFRELLAHASTKGVIICLEPTPALYGADFITNTDEAIEFIDQVDSPFLQLNLDIGAIIANHEDVAATIVRAGNRIQHVHLSEPNLKRVSFDMSFHTKIRDALRSINYTGTVCIEMLPQLTQNFQVIRDTLAFVKTVYGDPRV